MDYQIEQALLEQPGLLTDIYQLAVAFEEVNWKRLDDLIVRLKLDQEVVYQDYQNAQKWVQHILKN